MRARSSDSDSRIPSNEEERQFEDVARQSARLNTIVVGFTTGIMCGALVFVATIWLVIKGGDSVGPHLSLLSQYFPGYSVTGAGSLVGLAWGFVFGAVAGVLLS